MATAATTRLVNSAASRTPIIHLLADDVLDVELEELLLPSVVRFLGVGLAAARREYRLHAHQEQILPGTSTKRERSPLTAITNVISTAQIRNAAPVNVLRVVRPPSVKGECKQNLYIIPRITANMTEGGTINRANGHRESKTVPLYYSCPQLRQVPNNF